jgi:LPXTG-site transpeptidase (sortase) family protein
MDAAARPGLRTLARVVCTLAVSASLVSCTATAERPHAIAARPAPSTATTGVNKAAQPILPVRLRIPAIGVDSRLEKLGVSRRGRLQPPVDPQRAGWFPGSAVPGEVGSAVIAGHRDSLVGPAVFWRLTDLRPGDKMTVTRSDGVVVHFQVAQIHRVPRASFPTQQVYGATPDSLLRLITCGGLYDHVHGRYLDNVLVVALAV